MGTANTNAPSCYIKDGDSQQQQMLKMVPYNKGREGKARKSSVSKISVHELPFSIPFHSAKVHTFYRNTDKDYFYTKWTQWLLSATASKPQIRIL
jgi:hypothetical protein